MRAFPRLAVTLLGALALSCDPGPAPPALSPAAASARALVRPYAARNALRQATVRSGRMVMPGPTAVVLAHQTDDGTVRVGCVDSEDGAEDLVRSVEDTR